MAGVLSVVLTTLTYTVLPSSPVVGAFAKFYSVSCVSMNVLDWLFIKSVPPDQSTVGVPAACARRM